MPQSLRWDFWDASHIFPIAYEECWTQNSLDRWVTIEPQTGGNNSVQNNLLLRKNVLSVFDAYHFSINPDVSFYVRLSHAFFPRQLTSAYI